MGTEIRRWAEFETDLLDETVEKDHSIVFYGGEAVANALRELLKAPGRQVTDLDYAAECGWQFLVRTSRRAFYFQVQIIGHVLLTTDDITFPRILSKPNLKQLSEVLIPLNEAMRADGRFHNIRWCLEDEIFGEGPGTLTPVGLNDNSLVRGHPHLIPGMRTGMKTTKRRKRMRLLQAAEFQTDILEEWTEDEKGQEIMPGRVVAATLREMISSLGFRCDLPEYGGDHGWEFLCRSRGRDLWVSVISSGEASYYATVENSPWMPFLFWKDRPVPFDEVLTRLDEAMKTDGRFHGIRWGRQDDLFYRPFKAPTPLG